VNKYESTAPTDGAVKNRKVLVIAIVVSNLGSRANPVIFPPDAAYLCSIAGSDNLLSV
jgi:hypothetical protein